MLRKMLYLFYCTLNSKGTTVLTNTYSVHMDPEHFKEGFKTTKWYLKDIYFYH